MLIPVPGGQTLSLDLSQTTQLATAFGVNSATINGNAPGSLTGLAINASGVLSFQYSNGASQNAYVIPLANVPSPDNLTSALGDAYQTNNTSGPLQVGNAGRGRPRDDQFVVARAIHGRSGDRVDEHGRGAELLRGQFQGLSDRLRHSRHPEQSKA